MVFSFLLFDISHTRSGEKRGRRDPQRCLQLHNAAQMYYRKYAVQYLEPDEPDPPLD